MMKYLMAIALTLLIAAPAAAHDACATLVESEAIEQGDWLVGYEVQPGIYRSPGMDPDNFTCFISWYDEDGDIMDMESGGEEGEPVLAIIPEDAFIVSNTGCQPFVRVDLEAS